MMLLWSMWVLMAGAYADRSGKYEHIAAYGAVPVWLPGPSTFFAVEHAPLGLAIALLLALTACHATYAGPTQAWSILWRLEPAPC